VVVATSTNIQMLQMILAGRADYYFTSEEEAEHIIMSSIYYLQPASFTRDN